MPVEGVYQRLLTAVLVVVPLALVVFLTPAIYGALLLTLMALAGAWEWAGFFSHVNTVRRSVLVALIAVAMVLAWLAGPQAVTPMLWVAMAWWVIAFIWLMRFPTAIPAWLILLGCFLVLVPAWLALVTIHTTKGPEWLTFFFVLITAADSGAYFSGKAIGKTKLAPNVSPGKTWEGVGGGLTLVILVSGLAALWFNLAPVYLISLCMAVALVSVVGDLTISMFKRNAGLKDSGRLFPGHGGVLDRIDSISAGAPLFLIGLGWSQHII